MGSSELGHECLAAGIAVTTFLMILVHTPKQDPRRFQFRLYVSKRRTLCSAKSAVNAPDEDISLLQFDHEQGIA